MKAPIEIFSDPPQKSWPTQKILTHEENFDPRKKKLTHATHVKIWPTQPTHPRDLADSDMAFSYAEKVIVKYLRIKYKYGATARTVNDHSEYE